MSVSLKAQEVQQKTITTATTQVQTFSMPSGASQSTFTIPQNLSADECIMLMLSIIKELGDEGIISLDSFDIITPDPNSTPKCCLTPPTSI